MSRVWVRGGQGWLLVFLHGWLCRCHPLIRIWEGEESAHEEDTIQVSRLWGRQFQRREGSVGGSQIKIPEGLKTLVLDLKDGQDLENKGKGNKYRHSRQKTLRVKAEKWQNRNHFLEVCIVVFARRMVVEERGRGGWSSNDMESVPEIFISERENSPFCKVSRSTVDRQA